MSQHPLPHPLPQTPPPAPPPAVDPHFVGYWMTTPVRTVSPATPVLAAFDLMMQLQIRRLPVVDGQELVGIITQGDLQESRPALVASLREYHPDPLIARMSVHQVMTRNVVTVTATTPIREAAQLMLTHKIGGLPVIDPQGHPIGMLTEADLFRGIIRYWDDQPAAGGTPQPANLGRAPR